MKTVLKISNIKTKTLKAGNYVIKLISMKEKKGRYKYYELSFKILNNQKGEPK